MFQFDRRNLARRTRLVSVGFFGAGLIGPAAFLAAPAIGGAIGVAAGYSGAAASSFGLAALGGGSIAAGGLGMVGGTYVVAAAGAALGGALGANITNAYVSEDKSFAIELFRQGTGTPVIIARGFTTEKDWNWRSATELAEKHYPDSPIYRLKWGSKELANLAIFSLGRAGVRGGAVGLAKVGARANIAAAQKINPVGWAMLAAGVAKNPWHTALVRADRTGVALAGILARTDLDRVILIGHSLGGRAMMAAVETLGTADDGPTIEAVHLLGAAHGRKADWRTLSSGATVVHNYHSRNDAILKWAFKVAQFGDEAVGRLGFGSQFANIVDHDVTDQMPIPTPRSIPNSHSGYFENVTLA